MAVERTLAIIKPDAVAKNVIGKILAMIEDIDLRIIAAKMVHLSDEEIGEFYAEHKERPFYPSLIKYMTSGPVMIYVIEGENAVPSLRKLMGATAPKEAEPDTIRYLHAEHEYQGDTLENAIHGSDSTASAEREIPIFFDANELCPRTR